MKAIDLPNGLYELSKIFAANGYTLYLVGGYVRNIALGIPGGDFDVCSAAHPETAAAFLRKAGLRVIEKAPALGTIEGHLVSEDEKLVFEHTTFRRDFYPQGGSHRPDKVVFSKHIREDAKRRDFTVNALYLNIATGDIIDPTNKGVIDIENKVIRAAADDPDETIRDDGLRIMRMARFAAELKFSISSDLISCAAKRAETLKDISGERKRDELIKILMSDTRYEEMDGAEFPPEHGLCLLVQTGALKHILPLLSEGYGVAQAKEYHMFDVLRHGIRACAVAQPILPLRLAALLHDIGKPRALIKSGNMYGHQNIGEGLARQELNNLRFDNKTKSVVLPLIKNHMFDLEGKAKPKTIRRRAVLLGKEIFTLLTALRRADFNASRNGDNVIKSADNWQKELDRMIEEDVPWSVKDLAITGHDVISALHIKPSQKVGDILGMLFKECVAHPKMNDYQTLIKRASEIKEQ